MNMDVTIYPKTFESKIGFDAVRKAIESHCTCALSLDKAKSMHFLANAEEVHRQLRMVKEMKVAIHSDSPYPVGHVDDVSDILLQARVVGTHIDESGLMALRRQLTNVSSIISFFVGDDPRQSYPLLYGLMSDMQSCEPVLKSINRVLSHEGIVKDNASAQLASIRGQLAGIAARISNALRRVIGEGVRAGMLDADISPSMRDGRLVIPVAPMHKRAIRGIVHDESASGKTIFIEPAEVVELNNQRRELEMDERREVIRILVELSGEIRPHIPVLLANNDIVATLDFIRAKALYADESNGNLPNLSSLPELEWYSAKHPGLETALQSHGRRIVALNIHLAADKRILVISGPNAGGKSVTLKTVGIIQYMTQCGILPTVAENSHLGIFRQVFADIGDDQSIEDDLSTYSSHLAAMKFFLAKGNSDTLFMIDEFGSGTEPQIGAAIAQAMLVRFNNAGMWGIVTTHYQNLKTLADETPGLINGSMMYDRQRMQPLFTLNIGYPGSSFAIEIAKKTGIPTDVISEASQIVGDEYINLDKYLMDIARDRKYWENKRDKIHRREKHLEEVIKRYEVDAEDLRSKRRVIIDDARKEAEKIIAGSNAAVERAIREIKNAQAERLATAEARRKLAEHRRSMEGPVSEKDINDNPTLTKAPRAKRKSKELAKPQNQTAVAVGDNVLLDNSGRPGTVLSIDGSGKRALVAFGEMKISVDVSRLSKTMRKDSNTKKASSFVSVSTAEDIRNRQLNFNTEIDLRGMRADEALQAVTYFIDDALQFGINRVRILHGTGTGALRTVIRQYLDTVKGIQSFRDEDVRFGGAGITVVEM